MFRNFQRNVFICIYRKFVVTLHRILKKNAVSVLQHIDIFLKNESVKLYVTKEMCPCYSCLHESEGHRYRVDRLRFLDFRLVLF